MLPTVVSIGSLYDLARLESETAKGTYGCGGGRQVSTRDDEDERTAGEWVSWWDEQV